MDAVCIARLYTETSQLQSCLIEFDFQQMLGDLCTRLLKSFQIARRKTHFRLNSVRADATFSGTQTRIMRPRRAAKKRPQKSTKQHQKSKKVLFVLLCGFHTFCGNYGC